MSLKHVYTIKDSDVGLISVKLASGHWCNTYGAIGTIRKIDVGKHVYNNDGIVQVENEKQFKNRLDAVAKLPNSSTI